MSGDGHIEDGGEIDSVDDAFLRRVAHVPDASPDDTLTVVQARLGKTLCGKYRLDRLLGLGGMGAVYAATHLRNANQVAVKVLHVEFSIDSNVRARFLREGYAANSVEHSGTVRILDDHIAEDGSVFLVMDLLEGETLDARWERSGRKLGVPEVVTVVNDLLDVLTAAHAKGVVHRDIKPENLFVTREGELKVLDFGIARMREGPSMEGATKTGRVMGTPAFMPPEQALGRDIDGQTDLWAVGATMFTLASGHHVHEAETPEEMLVRAGSQPARSVATVAPHLPPGIVAVIDRALAFDKVRRWAGAQEMRRALREACVDVMGPPVAPLPKCELPITGLEDTVAHPARANGHPVTRAHTEPLPTLPARKGRGARNGDDVPKRVAEGRPFFETSLRPKTAIAVATRKAYATNYLHFRRWAETRGLPATPPAVPTVVVYLEALADGNVEMFWHNRQGHPRSTRKVHKHGSVLHAYISIAHEVRAAGHEWPRAIPAITKMLHDIKYRNGNRTKRVAPLEIADLRACLAKMRERRFEDLTVIRDRALLTIGFFSACHRAELVALRVEDIKFTPEGLQLQFAEGPPVAIHLQKDKNVCPVTLLQRYLNVSELKTGPLFRRIDGRSDCMGDRALTPQAVTLVVKQRAEAAGLDPAQFAAHSLRAGFMISAAAKGVSLHDIMRQTRHRSERVAMSYIRSPDLFHNNATEGLGDEPEEKTEEEEDAKASG